MKVLGLSYGYHDSSASLIVDGKLICSSREENHTRQKHDSFFPEFAIESCLTRAGITLDQIDKVAFYEKTENKWGRVLSSSLKSWPLSLPEFKTSMKTWLGKKLWTEVILKEKLSLKDHQLISFDHHESHAAQAFLGSEFQDAAILTVDAVGEWETCTQYSGKWENGKPVFQKLESSKYPHSLGLFYSAITEYLGFRPMNDECSTMALAAFGDDRFVDQMRTCLTVQKGKINLNTKLFQFDRYFSKSFTNNFEALFGPAGKRKYNFSSFEKREVSSEEYRLASVAYAAQQVFEECMLELAKHLKEVTKSENLCLAGGAALNCVANSKLMKEAGFKNIFIPVDPGDGGASLGAAFLAHYKEFAGEAILKRSSVSLGASYESDDLDLMMREILPAKIQKFKKIGLKKNSKETWKTLKEKSEDSLVEKVANCIDQGKIVGWFQEGVESGPRALGYRSLLFRADDLSLAQKVSQEIKNRASFRPYALSMNQDFAKLALDIDSLDRVPLRYMQLAIKVKKEYGEKIKTGCHIDQTTRPQVVFEDENPKYSRLLASYGKLSGHACFVNTSFNESGYPIVETPYDALLMFARTNMDVLVINNMIIEKMES